MRGPESHMGPNKTFSDIWLGALLGKLEASAAWKKFLEILLSGVLGKMLARLRARLPGGLGWHWCLENGLGGEFMKSACEVACKPLLISSPLWRPPRRQRLCCHFAHF